MGVPRELEKIAHGFIFAPENVNHSLMFKMGMAFQRFLDESSFVARQALTSGVYPKEYTDFCLAKYLTKRIFHYPEKDIRGLKITATTHEGTAYKKEKIMWFVGWEKVSGEWHAEHKLLYTNRCFLNRAKAISDKRKEDEFKIIKAKEDIDRIRNLEQGRAFKGRLRQIIMERDGYKCVLCGKSAADDVALEVDHIKAWEDGGKTIYDNGRTVCSECNKGLHWAKKYNEKRREVEASA